MLPSLTCRLPLLLLFGDRVIAPGGGRGPRHPDLTALIFSAYFSGIRVYLASPHIPCKKWRFDGPAQQSGLI